MSFHNVKLVNDGSMTKPAHVFLDGKEIHGVKSISFHQSVDDVPIIHLEIMAKFELDGFMDTDIKAKIETK